MKKIALCFYGINRSLSITAQSIQKNVIDPWSKTHQVHLYGAFVNPEHGVNNPRSGEIGLKTESESLKKLDFETIQIISQEKLDSAINFESLLSDLIDHYKDQHKSSKNIFRSLYALKKSYALASASGHEFDMVAFLRADLFYIDEWDTKLLSAYLNGNTPNKIVTPTWQQWGGLNDRMALCKADVASKFAQRFDHLYKFCKSYHQPLHSETALLCFCLEKKLDYQSFMNERAIRVRANGNFEKEAFSDTGINQESYEKLSKIIFKNNPTDNIRIRAVD